MPRDLTPQLDLREEHHWIAGPRESLTLFLRRLKPLQDEPAGVVLYVHGATFPSALSIAHRFEGFSWRDALCAAGFDVWGLDFHGFGESDASPDMSEAADAHPPLGSAEDAEAQLEAALRFELARTGALRLSIIAHSWGGMPACRVPAAHPSSIERLVLFAPIARRASPRYQPRVALPAWLFDAFSAASDKRDVKISRATHLMHLETMRHALYSESIAFLLAGTTSHSQNTQTEPTHGERVMTPADEKPHIPGYDFGSPSVAKSPITMEEWEALKKSAFFSEDDVVHLRLSHDVLADHVEDLLTVWRGIIFDHPHLRAYDENPQTGEVDTAYATAVKKRFGQWVLDTASAKYDKQWLDYQYEIGLRHHRTKKNRTDGGHTLGHIRARDLLAFCAAIVTPMKPYLASKGHSAEIVNRMYDAWWKSMILQATLWVQPYIKDGDF
ncbi:MAG TPA: alpha/beta fold hydrolase [Gemmatimonadaceae bacterium]|nr:alpha/beta fold hydrolase [Gemmatimonadaceae bacterium]